MPWTQHINEKLNHESGPFLSVLICGCWMHNLHWNLNLFPVCNPSCRTFRGFFLNLCLAKTVTIKPTEKSPPSPRLIWPLVKAAGIHGNWGSRGSCGWQGARWLCAGVVCCQSEADKAETDDTDLNHPWSFSVLPGLENLEHPYTDLQAFQVDLMNMLKNIFQS